MADLCGEGDEGHTGQAAGAGDKRHGTVQVWKDQARGVPAVGGQISGTGTWTLVAWHH